ncbi:helix-turn-helix domain-containing protein [Streptomyces formicae]
MQGFTELRLDPLDRLPISLAAHQGATLLSLLADAFGQRSQGVPPRWRRLVRSAISKSPEAILGPLFAPGSSVIPDCVTPTACMPGGDVATLCAQIADLPPDTLLAELGAEFGTTVPERWRPVVDRPRHWLHAYAQLSQCVWREFEPVWKQAKPHIQREAERVGAAVLQGCADLVFQDLSPRFRLQDGSLYLPDPQADTFRLNGRRLVLVPIVSGPGASMFALDRPDLVWIGYPLPAIGRIWEASAGAPAPKADALSLVAGPLRAAILRAAAQSLTMGEVARLLGCSASNATHHCRQLADAGLIDRQQHGRHVRIRRTERGDAVVDLLSAIPASNCR